MQPHPFHTCKHTSTTIPTALSGTKLSAPCPLSPPLAALAAGLDSLRAWVDEIPPAQQSLRYGNPAYRTWFARMAAAAPDFMRKVCAVGGQLSRLPSALPSCWQVLTDPLPLTNAASISCP